MEEWKLEKHYLTFIPSACSIVGCSSHPAANVQLCAHSRNNSI